MAKAIKKGKKKETVVFNTEYINEDYVIASKTKRELSLNMDYVEEWGITQAIREIFQNALDAQSKTANNPMFFNYNQETKFITVANKKGALEIRSLLFGSSSKRGDDKQIGQFGEGYKVASVVLLRTGHSILIYNYSKKQIWHIRKSKSSLYDASIVVADIYRIDNWTKRPQNGLIFEIGNITNEEYRQVVASNLMLQESEGDLGEIHETPYGRLLCDTRFKGQIYVSGLYISTDKALDKGYDFKPKYIKLDRDRGLIEDYDLKGATAKILNCITKPEIVAEMVDKKDAYFYETSYEDNNRKQVSDIVATKFNKEHGEKSYPVSNQSEADRAKDRGFEPIIVSETRKTLIKNSALFKREEQTTIQIPLMDRVERFFESIRYRITSSDVKEMESLRKELKKKLGSIEEVEEMKDYATTIYEALDEDELPF